MYHSIHCYSNKSSTHPSITSELLGAQYLKPGGDYYNWFTIVMASYYSNGGYHSNI